MAAVARWMSPFSGPIQRSCESEVSARQKPAKSRVISETRRPTTSGAIAFAHATQSSLPRPMVKARPLPSSPGASVRSVTYAAE